MSLSFLPLPIYVLFCIIVFVMLLFLAISRRTKDRKGLLAIYYTLALCFPFAALGRLFTSLYDMAAQIVYIILLISFIELTIMRINDFRNGCLERRAVVGLFMVWFGTVFYILIFLHII